MDRRRTTVLITGASSGIGEEFANIFAREGFSLVLVARNREKLERLKEQYEKNFHSSVIVIVQDLSVDGAAQIIAHQLEERNISINILVNNAGLGASGSFCEEDVVIERSVLMVNIVALTQLTRLLLPGMLTRKNGKILNIGSIASFVPGPSMAVYFATKAYVLSFSEALAKELEDKNVSVTLLCPGPTRTAFFGDDESIKGYKDPALVAIYGYHALMRGDRIVMPDMKYRLLFFIQRFIPRSVALNIVAHWLR